MWELDYKESWAPNNWCFWTVVLEKTPESPLDCKEIQPVHPKGDQSWVFIGRTDVEAETPILWPSDVKNWLTGKDPDAGKDWRQEEKGTTEDEMVGWHHWLNGHGFEWTPGVGDGQGGLACCGSWGCKESTPLSDWTELNDNEMPKQMLHFSCLCRAIPQYLWGIDSRTPMDVKIHRYSFPLYKMVQYNQPCIRADSANPNRSSQGCETWGQEGPTLFLFSYPSHSPTFWKVSFT